MYSLIHEEYKSKHEVDEVLYLVEYTKPDSSEKKVISRQLHYIRPRQMITYARALASEAWREIMTQLNTYGIDAAKELLEYEVQHLGYIKERNDLEEL